MLLSFEKKNYIFQDMGVQDSFRLRESEEIRKKTSEISVKRSDFYLLKRTGDSWDKHTKKLFK